MFIVCRNILGRLTSIEPPTCIFTHTHTLSVLGMTHTPVIKSAMFYIMCFSFPLDLAAHCSPGFKVTDRFPPLSARKPPPRGAGETVGFLFSLSPSPPPPPAPQPPPQPLHQRSDAQRSGGRIGRTRRLLFLCQISKGTVVANYEGLSAK